MAVSRITWDGNTLDLPRLTSSWVHAVKNVRTDRWSADGHYVAHHRNYLWRVHVTFRGPIADTVERDLWTWQSWAQRGNTYAVAHISDDNLNTTFDDTAAAAQKVCPLTATTNAVAGDLMLLTNAARTIYEIIKIDTVVADVSVTSTTDLKNAFASGDSCRHLYYMPSCHMLGTEASVKVEGEGSTNMLYLDHMFEEDLG